MSIRSKKTINPKLLSASDLSSKVKRYYETNIRGKVKNQIVSAKFMSEFTKGEVCALLGIFTSDQKHSIVPLITHCDCVAIYREMFTSADKGYGNLIRVNGETDPICMTIDFKYIVDVVNGLSKRDAKGAKRTRDDRIKLMHDTAFAFATSVYGLYKEPTDKKIRDLIKGIRVFGVMYWEVETKEKAACKVDTDETLIWLKSLVRDSSGAVDPVHRSIEMKLTALTGII